MDALNQIKSVLLIRIKLIVEQYLKPIGSGKLFEK